MLRRIDALNGCGIFSSYKWTPDCPEFERLNVIYGANGSGKTCLAQAFAAACNDPAARGCLSITIEEDGSRRHPTTSDDVFERIYVFSKDYVSRSHRFYDPKSPDMQAILTIGQKSAEAEDRLVELTERMAASTDEVEKLKTLQGEAGKQRDKLLTGASEKVVGDLTKVGGQYQSRSHYSVKTVENKLRGNRDHWKTLTAGELAQDREIVNSPKQDPVEFSCSNLEVPNQSVLDAGHLLKASASTVVLDTLKQHPEATQWVQEGRSLHDGIEKCLFCGSALTSERKQQIDQHFSREVQSLESGIQDAISWLETLATDVKTCQQSMPPGSALYKDLRGSYKEARDDFEGQLQALERWIDGLSTRLRRKLTNVLRSDTDEVTAPPTVDSSRVLATIEQHNARALDHEMNVKNAAARIEKHHLHQTAAEIDKLDKEIANTTQQLRSLDSEIASLRAEITSLENVEADPTPSAGVLNREVARLLGRNELSFSPVGSRYQVLRNGKPALGLSEGECTAIILVHFMESVARHGTPGKRPIVIIDDPVSSLDSSVFMGVSTYIWSECVTRRRAAQVILLTHNFELFRQWDIQLEGLGRNKSTKQEFPYRTYEISTRHKTVNGVTARAPVLAEWPPPGVSRQKARSSYVHAFMALAEAKKRLNESLSLDNLLDAHLLLPNVIRRVLEGFIGFKRPDLAGSFDVAMRECGPMLVDAGYKGDANALRLQLTRFAHAYSHAQNPDITAMNDPTEIVPALTAVFEFMNAIDHGHFEGLCKVAKVDGGSILLNSCEEESR